MQNKKVKDRIQKLLALGTSPNEYEAKCAILKAKKLMAEYKLSGEEFAKTGDLPIGVESGLFFTTRKDHWIGNLSKVIAENNCCITFARTRPKSQKHRIVFYGYENDAKICNETFVYAVDCVRNLFKPIKKKIKRHSACSSYVVNAAMENYGLGFCAGLEQAYLEQMEQNYEEWGLVMVVPPSVKEYESSLGMAEWNDPPPLQESEVFYNMGFEEGLNFTIKDQLDVPIGRLN